MSLSARSFGYVAELVRRESAVELTGKEYLVASRLAPLARAAGLEGADAVDRYVHLVRGCREEARRVVEAVVVTETSWFRDGAPFRALTGELVPALRLRRRPLRVWSAGCSTGPDAWTDPSFRWRIRQQRDSHPSSASRRTQEPRRQCEGFSVSPPDGGRSTASETRYTACDDASPPGLRCVISSPSP